MNRIVDTSGKEQFHLNKVASTEVRRSSKYPLEEVITISKPAKIREYSSIENGSHASDPYRIIQQSFPYVINKAPLPTHQLAHEVYKRYSRPISLKTSDIYETNFNSDFDNFDDDFTELEGDIEALKLIDLDREGLKNYKEYLKKIDKRRSSNGNSSFRNSTEAETSIYINPNRVSSSKSVKSVSYKVVKPNENAVNTSFNLDNSSSNNNLKNKPQIHTSSSNLNKNQSFPVPAVNVKPKPQQPIVSVNPTKHLKQPSQPISSDLLISKKAQHVINDKANIPIVLRTSKPKLTNPNQRNSTIILPSPQITVPSTNLTRAPSVPLIKSNSVSKPVVDTPKVVKPVSKPSVKPDESELSSAYFCEPSISAVLTKSAKKSNQTEPTLSIKVNVPSHPSLKLSPIKAPLPKEIFPFSMSLSVSLSPSTFE